MNYTIDDIMSLRPCYTRDRVAALFCDRTECTAAEIANAPIPHADRIWVLVRLATHRTRVLWACDCAERALLREREAGREPDARSLRAIETARAWTRGEATDDELSAAWAAARAAWAAARAAAARAAARAAAWADAAAWAELSAAWAAARAARAAAWAADAECEWQIARLVEMIEATP